MILKNLITWQQWRNIEKIENRVIYMPIKMICAIKNLPDYNTNTLKT